jgi:uncharacterized protein DUF4154
MQLLRIILILVMFSGPAVATQPALEYKVKAAYLFNFTKFISWPENASDTFNLCIVEPNPFGSMLQPLEKRSVAGKPIKIRYITSVEKVTDCHILYIDKVNKIPVGFEIPKVGILAITSLGSVLNVSSQPFFARQGGMIGFVLRDGRVKLQVNLKTLKQHGFQVSAKLMEVAEQVKTDE